MTRSTILRFLRIFGVPREALVRLTAEGLAVNQPQFGFKVISLTLEDLTDLTATRCQIEGMVLRDAIAHGDCDWATRVLIAHHRTQPTRNFENGDGSRVTQARAPAPQEFHEALLSGARNQRLRTSAANGNATNAL